MSLALFPVPLTRIKFIILFVLTFLTFGATEFLLAQPSSNGGPGAPTSHILPAYHSPRSTPTELRPNWIEYFETETPTWRRLHSENRGILADQERTQLEFHQGHRAEMLRCELPCNSCIVLGHPIGFPVVIEDLSPTLCVKSNQPGVAIGAQIVLPNAIHPETGKPITFIVPGTKYSGSGEWEKLGFWSKEGRPNLESQVERIGGSLRAELRQNLDLRGRYVRQLVLLVESVSTHSTVVAPPKTVWIDSLEIFGHVAASPEIVNRFEKTPNGGYPLQFDPLNFVGFKIQAGHHSVFVQPMRSEGPGGYTEWTTPLAGHDSKPLSATPDSRYARSSTRNTSTTQNAGNLTAKSAQQQFMMPPTSPRLENPKQRSLFSDETEIRFALTNQPVSLEEGISPASMMQIRFSDRLLFVNDVPTGVRAIQYNGEPLAFLRQLEFNTVWVKGKATPELLREARDAGVWIICAPPGILELDRARTFGSTTATERDRSSFLSTPLIDPMYDNVLAWNLGDECSLHDLGPNTELTTVLQSADRSRRRPVLCTARSGVREYSRIADVLMMQREPLLSSLEMTELRRWQNTYPSLARPDTPFWSTIQTQPSPKLANQWIMFGGNPQDICSINYEQLKMQVYQALAIGAHGLLFTSHTPLTNQDAETEFRRTALELINWEMQLIENWFSAGREASALVRSNNSGMASAVLQAGRSRLLLPIWQEPQSQMVVGAAKVGQTRYVISGIPQTYNAYQLTPGRLSPLATERVAGGMQIVLTEANLNSLIFFSEEDSIYARVEKHAKVIGPRAAFLACKLADLQLASTERVLATLKKARETKTIPIHPKDGLPLVTVNEQESMIKTTKEAIDLAKRFASQNPPAFSDAFIQAEVATRGLRVVARDMLREATRHEPNVCMTPVSVSFATLPLYLNACQRLHGARPGENRLPAGDMENVFQWQQVGWGHGKHRLESVPNVLLNIGHAARRSGENGLQIIAQSDSNEDGPSQTETAPVWVTTPSVPVQMGEMICVNGWVRIPQPIRASVDGLMIFDSLGGEGLAVRILETAGIWQEFVFYRYVPADGIYHVAFALHGIGEVHLDDVRISPIHFDTAPPPAAPSQPQPAPTPWQRFNPFNYLPPFPTRN